MPLIAETRESVLDHFLEIQSMFYELRDEKKKKFNRIIPINELITDRWEKARYANAGKGTSIYDSSFIIGDVEIGKNCWIGMDTVLDGSGGKLKIGDNCSISKNVQIYTHDSIAWALTGKAPYNMKETQIGDHCYIGPNSVISMGVKIGDHSVIGTNSFVNKNIPPYSIAFGNPAKVKGKIKIENTKIEFEYF